MENTQIYLMRRDGRFSTPGATTVGVRLDAAMLKAIDNWGRRHGMDWRGHSSRPAAIRKLIEQALSPASR